MGVLSSNIEWQRWGESDPLWAVSAWDGKQRGAAAAWTDEEFIALGRSDWADFLARWQQYGVAADSCLEVGCGAGRMTRQLSAAFRKVHAVDVSSAMIVRARRIAPAANVTFHQVSGLSLPQSDCSVSAVFSTHVLQHLNSYEDGLTYFREFFRVLQPGGTLMVHLPLYQLPHGGCGFTRLLDAEWRAFRVLDNALAAIRRALHVPLMRLTPYPLHRLVAALNAFGFHGVEIRVFETKSNGSLHPFVFATKRAS